MKTFTLALALVAVGWIAQPIHTRPPFRLDAENVKQIEDNCGSEGFLKLKFGGTPYKKSITGICMNGRRFVVIEGQHESHY